ncbi:MAG TPA: sugar phosphate nucleotidyltransferase, partial [Hyphomicrobiaceae bacterium]|nr:sugar phosphate nucleotidyltransferase [Hyphomicrobiaceae bacterium]
NGDVLTDLDFTALLAAHKSSGAALTIAANRQNVKIDLGVLETDTKGWLTGYIEKPEHQFDVSMGVYVYEPRVLKLIKRDEYLDFPDLVRMLLARGEHVHVHRNNAFWLDIGRPEDYAKAQDIFEAEPERFGLEAA